MVKSIVSDGSSWIQASSDNKDPLQYRWNSSCKPWRPAILFYKGLKNVYNHTILSNYSEITYYVTYNKSFIIFALLFLSLYTYIYT